MIWCDMLLLYNIDCVSENAFMFHSVIHSHFHFQSHITEKLYIFNPIAKYHFDIICMGMWGMYEVFLHFLSSRYVHAFSNFPIYLTISISFTCTFIHLTWIFFIIDQIFILIYNKSMCHFNLTDNIGDLIPFCFVRLFEWLLILMWM